MIECPDCALLQHSAELRAGEWSACARCGAQLAYARAPGFESTLALSLAAGIGLVIAMATPFLEFAFRGRRAVGHLSTGIELLWTTGFEPLAVLVAATVLVAPLCVIGGLIAVAAPLRWGRCPRYVARVYRFVLWVRPWAMLEVFLLGALVAVVKLGQLASVDLHGGFYAIIAVVPLMLAALDALDPRAVWQAVDAAQGERAAAGPSYASASEVASQASPMLTCSVCSLRTASLAAPEAGIQPPATQRCPRCGEPLVWRRPFAVQRSVALLLAAAILYVPANVLPVLRLDLMGRGQADTILEGVESLIAGGLWEVAILVFFASFLVPGLKIFGLGGLLWSLRRPVSHRTVARTRLYRVIDQVGRWSMIDVFMTAVLVGLVQLGAIATIVPGMGAMCFAAVVVLTLYAARSFEPRALWDFAEGTDD